MTRTIAALLLLLACAPSRSVMIEGRAVPYEQAAREEFRKAKQTLDQGKFELAAAQFGAFVESYPDSELTDEAIFRRGQALEKAGKLQEAQAVLQDFLEKRPTSPFKSPAAVELGLVQARLGQEPAKAAPPDTSQMSEKEKNQAASALAESYARSGQAGEAARWAARAVENAQPGADQDARLKEFETALEAAPAEDVARLVADLDKKSPAWPAAALKLCRIQLHVGDRTHAADLAAQVLRVTQYVTDVPPFQEL